MSVFFVFFFSFELFQSASGIPRMVFRAKHSVLNFSRIPDGQGFDEDDDAVFWIWLELREFFDLFLMKYPLQLVLNLNFFSSFRIFFCLKCPGFRWSVSCFLHWISCIPDFRTSFQFLYGIRPRWRWWFHTRTSRWISSWI